MTHTKKMILWFMVFGLVAIMAFTVYAADEKTASGKGEKGLININTAGSGDLVKLPRIGEKMAERIIEFRKKNGNFKKIEDLMKVKGIGEKTFQKLEKLVTI